MLVTVSSSSMVGGDAADNISDSSAEKHSLATANDVASEALYPLKAMLYFLKVSHHSIGLYPRIIIFCWL